MKKLYTFLALLLSLATFAQAPEGFNYQATVRNSAGTLITNKNIDFTFKIIKDSPTGTAVYSETRTVTTDDLGAVSLVVGKGTPTTGTFSAIDWSSGTYYLGIELNTGSGNVAMGTTQLLSVPYALYAKTAGTSQNLGRVSIYIQGNVTDQQAAAQIAHEFGPLTENIYVKDTKGLTTLDFSKLITAIKVEIDNNKDLVSLNLNGLSTIGDQLEIRQNPLLTSLNLPLLTAGSFYVNDNTSLTSLSLPVLAWGDIDLGNTPLTLLNLPLLTSGNVYVANSSLVSLSLPVFASGYLDISNNKSLTSLNIPAFTQSTSVFRAHNNALPSSEINKLLNILNTKVTFTGYKSIYMSGQVPKAPPTGQGLIDKQALINKGSSVETD